MKFYYYYNVPQQYIDIGFLLQYIDDLKTRIYKAFCRKSRRKVYHLQLFSANSPLLMLISAKSNIEDMGYRFDLFELGYLVFSLSENLCLDASFYAYYNENTFLGTIHLFSSLIDKIKHAVAIFCLEPYQTYLLSRSNLVFDRFEHSEALNRLLLKRKGIFNQALSFKIESGFNYFHVHTLVKRLPLHQSIKLHLLKFLSSIQFNDTVSNFYFSPDQIVFAKNGKQLFAKLLHTCICFVSIEVYTAADIINQHTHKALFINCNSTLFVLSDDSLMLSLLSQELNNFLRFNAIKLAYDMCLNAESLVNIAASKLLFTIMHREDYPLSLVTRPSLFSQFNLMRRISFVVSYSVSQPLPLLIIRLNKLLLNWMNPYFCCSIGKILYLIDYLIYLKLSMFMKKHCHSLHRLSISILFLLSNVNSRLVLNRPTNSFFASVATDYLCKNYIVVKMFWIYALRCSSS